MAAVLMLTANEAQAWKISNSNHTSTVEAVAAKLHDMTQGKKYDAAQLREMAQQLLVKEAVRQMKSDASISLAAASRSGESQCTTLSFPTSLQATQTQALSSWQFICPSVVDSDQWIGYDSFSSRKFSVTQTNAVITVRRTDCVDHDPATSTCHFEFPLSFYCCKVSQATLDAVLGAGKTGNPYLNE
eukprot:TRINITY_DN79252_c0_g1_i1.p1 TRINITY_DN79252_c0_g1~~TRINITY_DN79252_c0_g1_i1.p1  ORF type:complete len:219 (+),score=43.26 TRINITY_DN79252_c0_g1_i1:97-657(+)